LGDINSAIRMSRCPARMQPVEWHKQEAIDPGVPRDQHLEFPAQLEASKAFLGKPRKGEIRSLPLDRSHDFPMSCSIREAVADVFGSPVEC